MSGSPSCQCPPRPGVPRPDGPRPRSPRSVVGRAAPDGVQRQGPRGAAWLQPGPEGPGCWAGMSASPAPPQLQIVTYTGGRNLDGGTPRPVTASASWPPACSGSAEATRRWRAAAPAAAWWRTRWPPSASPASRRSAAHPGGPAGGAGARRRGPRPRRWPPRPRRRWRWGRPGCASPPPPAAGGAV